jgi:hypothetical protein
MMTGKTGLAAGTAEPAKTSQSDFQRLEGCWARPEKTQELHPTLQALLPAIRKENGCRDCRVCRDLGDVEIFFLTVDRDARANLETFMPTENGGALLGSVGLPSETARVRIGNNEPWEEIDTLKRMKKITQHLPGSRAVRVRRRTCIQQNTVH